MVNCTTTAAPIDRDVFLPEHACSAYGAIGRTAILGFSAGDQPPFALCAACAGERAHLCALVRACNPGGGPDA